MQSKLLKYQICRASNESMTLIKLKMCFVTNLKAIFFYLNVCLNCFVQSNHPVLPFFPDRLFFAPHSSQLIKNALNKQDINWALDPAKFSNNSDSLCAQHLNSLIRTFISTGPKKSIQALIDSYGRQESGLLQGNLHWPGEYRQCRSVRVAETDLPEFEGHYCTAVWSHKSPENRKFSFFSGVCIPNFCKNADQYLLKMIVKTFSSFKDSHLENISCLDHRPIQTDTVVCLLVLSFFLLLAIMSTVFDLHKDLGQLLRVSRCPKLAQFLGCFSLKRNLDDLLNTKQQKNDLGSVHGIRVFATLSVFLIHLHLNGRFFARNPVSLFRSDLRPLFYWLLHGCQAVDTFFTLSGLLVSYRFFLSSKRPNLVRFFLGRYIRLTPLLTIITFIHASLVHRIPSGPFWDYGQSHLSSRSICRDGWWFQLLYLNNLFGFNGMVGHFTSGTFILNRVNLVRSSRVVTWSRLSVLSGESSVFVRSPKVGGNLLVEINLPLELQKQSAWTNPLWHCSTCKCFRIIRNIAPS